VFAFDDPLFLQLGSNLLQGGPLLVKNITFVGEFLDGGRTGTKTGKLRKSESGLSAE